MNKRQELEEQLDGLFECLKESGLYRFFYDNSSFYEVINNIKQEIRDFCDTSYIKVIKRYGNDYFFVELENHSYLYFKIKKSDRSPNFVVGHLRKLITEYSSDYDIKYKDIIIKYNILLDDVNSLYFEEYKVSEDVYKELLNSNTASKNITAYGLNELYDSDGVKVKTKNITKTYNNMELGEVFEDLDKSMNQIERTKKYTIN